MNRASNLHGHTTDKILSLSLAELPVALKGSLVEELIQQLLTELRQMGLRFRPHFWISDEWFCPDGIPGIAVPFFVLDRRLRQIEKAQVGFVDGAKRAEMMRILRHEAGHAIDNAFRLRKWPGRRRLFGASSQPYPTSFVPQVYSRSFVKNLGHGYAQSHPDEDFAETFAVWLDPKSRWKSKYEGHRALEKLQWMDQCMEELRGRPAVNQNRQSYQPLHRMKITLREHYRRKKLRFGLLGGSPEKELDAKLQSLFSRHAKGRPRVAKFIERIEQPALKQISQAIGEPVYRVRPVIKRLKKRAFELDLKLTKNSGHSRQLLIDLLTEESLRHIEQGRHRVIL